MTLTALRASRRLWRRRELFRYRRWRFFREKSKRPAAEKHALRAKWWKLYAEAAEVRKRRDRQIARETPLRLRALAEAERLIGVMEQGGNNRGPKVLQIIRANGGAGPEPWCGDFVAWCYRLAGSKVVQRGWAAVRFIGFLTGMQVVKTPQAGDLVCFNFSHVGIFEKDLGGGYIETIEGNTGASGAVSDSKTGGDGVYRKRRSKSLVSRYVRVTR